MSDTRPILDECTFERCDHFVREEWEEPNSFDMRHNWGFTTMCGCMSDPRPCEPRSTTPYRQSEYDAAYEDRMDDHFDNPSLGAREWSDK